MPAAAAAFVALLIGCTVGGVLGGILLPPIASERARRSRVGAMQ